MKKKNANADKTINDRSTLQKPKRTDPTSEHNGYNEHNPSQPEGAFHPESKQSSLSQKNTKERPVVPEKKLKEARSGR